MKRELIATVCFCLFTATGAGAMEHRHEMSKGSATDERTELKLPDKMKVMQKKMMIKHLATVSEITAALASKDLKKAASLSRGRLGWNAAEEKKCSNVSDLSGEPDFLDFGMALHKQADALADAADAEDRDKALRELSELITRCNACHERFRH